LLRDGKEALESIITLVIPEYKCYALRAGWYNIMPSREVYSAMQNLGLKLDSSVYAGGYETGEITRYDYRRVPLNLDYWWASSKDITKVSKNKKEIIEVPIFSLMQPRWRKLLSPQKISSIIKNRKPQISSAVKAKVKNMSLIEKIKFLIKKESFTWDFCSFDLLMHKKYFDYIEANLVNKRKFYVLVGHSKGFKNEKAFKKFIRISNNRKYSFHFCTLRDIYNDIVN
jgi:hypothetical protein